MGGPAAPDDLELGYLAQTWLAVSNDAAVTASGGYRYHRQWREPAAQARDPAYQDQLTERLAALTDVALGVGYIRLSSSTGMVRTPAVWRSYSAKPG